MSKSICEWRKSPIHPKYYSVSNLGKVRNDITGRILKPGEDKDGYLIHILCYKGDRRTIKVHRLVALAFIPNPGNKPSIDHINGNRKDNRATNLRWVTNKENTNNPITLAKLAVAHSKTDYKAMGQKRNFGRRKTKVYKDGELVGVFASQAEAAKACNCNPGGISECLNNKRKTCKGFQFALCEDLGIEGDIRNYL